MNELDQLIREQRQDQRLGQYQPREMFVAFSLDADTGTGPVLDALDQDGTLHWNPSRHRPVNETCPLHGSTGMVLHADGRYRCRPCSKDRSQAARRAAGMKPRGRGPQCGHDPSNFKVYSGVKRAYVVCRPCAAARARSRYAKNPEAHRARQREKYHADVEASRAAARQRKERVSQGGSLAHA